MSASDKVPAAAAPCHQDDVEDGASSDDDENAWRGQVLVGDVPATTWKEYLTYGPTLVAERNDRVRKFFEQQNQTAAHECHGELQETEEQSDDNFKMLKSLTRAMTKDETMEAYRALTLLKQEEGTELSQHLHSRMTNKSTSKTDDTLSQWLAVHELLIAAGFEGGVFDEATEVKAFITPRSADWSNPEFAEEKRRGEAAYQAFKALDRSYEGRYNFSMASFQAAISKAVHMCSGLKLQVLQVVETTRTSEKRWRVIRSGELWKYLARGGVQEWKAFFGKHRRENQGVYAKSADSQAVIDVRI